MAFESRLELVGKNTAVDLYIGLIRKAVTVEAIKPTTNAVSITFHHFATNSMVALLCFFSDCVMLNFYVCAQSERFFLKMVRIDAFGIIMK